MSSEFYRSNLEYRQSVDDELRRTAHLCLQGEIGAIAASRIMSRLRSEISPTWSEMDEAFLGFVGVDSQTDAPPVGPEREMWGPAELASADREIVAAEDHFREAVRAACRRVLELLDSDVVTLWRPVGPRELELIRASGMREFPPRLPEQPIFYPVLGEAYAVRIARDWNAPRGGGFVFRLRRDFICRYPIQAAGGRDHLEYWIPADDLGKLNAAIVGPIEIAADFPATSEAAAKD